jgi:hypothetical protein
VNERQSDFEQLIYEAAQAAADAVERDVGLMEALRPYMVRAYEDGVKHHEGGRVLPAGALPSSRSWPMSAR